MENRCAIQSPCRFLLELQGQSTQPAEVALTALQGVLGEGELSTLCILCAEQKMVQPIRALIRSMEMDHRAFSIFAVSTEERADVFKASSTLLALDPTSTHPALIQLAQSMGLPIVIFEDDACQQFVFHAVTGLLVFPNFPDRLLQALDRIASDEAFRTRMSMEILAQ